MKSVPHLRLLGTGDTAQVPCFGCRCPACQRARAFTTGRRQPASAELRTEVSHYLLDAGRPELASMYDGDPPDGVLLTHYHVDHVQGLFALRWGKGEPIPVFGPDDPLGCADLHKHPGLLQFEPGLRAFLPFELDDIVVTPVPLNHSRPTFGYCLQGPNQKLAYLTDTQGLPPETERFLKQWRADTVLVDATFAPGEIAHNHNDVAGALAIIEALEPTAGYLTHISHRVDAADMAGDLDLPPGVALACDQQVLSL